MNSTATHWQAGTGGNSRAIRVMPAVAPTRNYTALWRPAVANAMQYEFIKKFRQEIMNEKKVMK